MITQTYINNIAYKIVGCAIEVHKELGPGLLESIYQRCFVKELELKGLKTTQQIKIPIILSKILNTSKIHTALATL